MYLKENSFKVCNEYMQASEDSSINSSKRYNHPQKLGNAVVPHAGML